MKHFPLLAAPLAFSPVALAGGHQPGAILHHEVIGVDEGGFEGSLAHADYFGHSVGAPGDLDGDNLVDVLVGAYGQGVGGAVWELLLREDGTVRDEIRIASNEAGFDVTLESSAGFGKAVEVLGDLDGDGLIEVAVGAPGSSSDTGTVWILTLATLGGVVSHTSIGSGVGGFPAILEAGDQFGEALALLGDLDGDGTTELAVGASGDDDGASGAGAIWVLSLLPDGSVASHSKISMTSGGFGGSISAGDGFATSLASPGDIDGDGIVDLAAGAPQTSSSTGAVWILFLNANGTVSGQVEIGSGGAGGWSPPELGGFDNFGCAVSNLGDLNGDGVVDLAVGAQRDGEVGLGIHGALWLLFLEQDGTVLDYERISAATPELSGLDVGDFFGSGIALLGDQNGDGVDDLAVGASQWQLFQSPSTGELFVLHLDGIVTAQADVYGCGVNPAGSMAVGSGELAPGESLELLIDNPAGTQASGSLPVVALSLGADPSFPCGTPVPGWGMSAPGSSGELLVGVTGLLDPLLVGTPWAGPGQPAPVDVAIPPNPILIGFPLYAQGALWDPAASQGIEIGLADAVALVIGN